MFLFPFSVVICMCYVIFAVKQMTLRDRVVVTVCQALPFLDTESFVTWPMMKSLGLQDF